MDTSLKVIISSKKNLLTKYGKSLKAVEKLLAQLVTADGKRKIKTQIVYIDDTDSATKAGITAVKSVTRQSAKKSVDEIYQKMSPAYIVLFGSNDVFPFQLIDNPANDEDDGVPSDLPYACDTGYSTNMSTFTGPTRVVGRIPDIQGNADLKYLKIVFASIINYKKVTSDKLMEYFAVTAHVWRQSTQQSLSNIFGNNDNLKHCPTSVSPHLDDDFLPLIHFYNCHGSSMDSKFYGQKGNKYPTALHSPDLNSKIAYGTVVAAECCYGAELFDPNNEPLQNLSIANTYFKNKAIAFTGSSTIAYGPASGNGLADLITQYFIRNVISGYSTGRALLEARHKFISVSGPYLDPYELKTLAQFYLLGDPSIHVTTKTVVETTSDTMINRRLNLSSKGTNLATTIAPSERVKGPMQKAVKPETDEMKKIFKQNGFTGNEEEVLYETKTMNKKMSTFAKGLNGNENISFRAYIQKPKKVNGFNIFDVLVLKESGSDILGWRLYHRK